MAYLTLDEAVYAVEAIAPPAVDGTIQLLEFDHQVRRTRGSEHHTLGALLTRDMPQIKLSEQKRAAFRLPVDCKKAPLAMGAGSYPLRVRKNLKRLQLQ